MTRPRPPSVTPAVDPEVNVHPAELRRLQKEFFSRVDHLAAAFQRKHDEAVARGALMPTDRPPDDPPWTAGA